MRAPGVDKPNSTRIDEGRKGRNLTSLAIKIQGAYRSGEAGGEPTT